MKTAIVLMVAILAQAVGNTCLSKGMKGFDLSGVTVDGASMAMLLDVAASPWIWIGTACMIVFFAFFSAALSWEDLSFVLPVISFGYIVNVAFAWHFLGEPVSATRWAGTAFIVLGVMLVSRTSTRSAERAVEGDGPGQHAGSIGGIPPSN